MIQLLHIFITIFLLELPLVLGPFYNLNLLIVSNEHVVSVHMMCTNHALDVQVGCAQIVLMSYTYIELDNIFLNSILNVQFS